jgi:hypothetical protein
MFPPSSLPFRQFPCFVSIGSYRWVSEAYARWLLFKYGGRLRNISPMALHDDQLEAMRGEQKGEGEGGVEGQVAGVETTA